MLTIPLRARASSPAFAGVPYSVEALPAANLLVLGTGVVGSEVIRQAQALARSPRLAGATVRLVGLANRRSAIFDRRGVGAGDVAELCRPNPTKRLPTPFDVAAWRTQIATLATLPEPVLVDCTDAPDMDVVYEEALARGVHVVTANKEPLVARLDRIAKVKAASARTGAQLRYEATVGAGLPIVRTLQSLVRTGDRVGVIDCAVSGTLAFVLEGLRRGVPLSRAVEEAVEAGLAEPDPYLDLSGLDVARKAVVLARELGAAIELEDVSVEPFVPRAVLDTVAKDGLAALERHDAECAAHFARLASGGRHPAYLARIIVEHLPGRRVSAHAIVGLAGVDSHHPAATLPAGSASVAFYTERYGLDPLVVQGAGAGGAVTAGALLADVLELSRTRHSVPRLSSAS